jgi:uncharacterized protein YxjI
MRLFKVNTTAYEEEDFFLLTDLSEQDIAEVINPIVMTERDGYEEYDNDTIISALMKRYPKNNITMIYEFEQLTY